MKNANQAFFRHIYPKRWLAQGQARIQNTTHYHYQEITLEKLECFDGCGLLECGCGSGELLARLRHRYPEIKLSGLDLGRDSMLWAKTVLNLKDSVKLFEGDLVALPFSSNRFDRVLSSSVLWYVPTPRIAIREMIRVLKPGGRFVFDVRSPYHITNMLTRSSLFMRRAIGQKVPTYSFFSPWALVQFLSELPICFEITGYFVLLPTRLPLLGSCWGNWARLFPWLSFRAGQGSACWLAQKLLVTGNKLEYV